MDQIQQIPLEDLHPSEGNRRVGGFDKAKLEQLAESIRAVGVQQPAVVRPLHDDGSHSSGEPLEAYEIVAGERRWRAAKIAGLQTLPCVVRELDDVAVLKIQTIENLQREDIHPLDEADGYARLLERAGYDVEHLAGEVGRSISYVYQRLKLRDLVPKARQQLIDGTITAGHGILISRLQPAQQAECLKQLQARWRGDGVISVRELDDYIHRQILLDLSKASFKRNDAELLPKAGPCTTCPKRTGFQPALFADVCNGGQRDYCTDPACFNAKLDALVARRKETAEAEGQMLVSTEYGHSGSEEKKLSGQGVKGRYEWEETKKNDPDAVAVQIAHIKVAGNVRRGELDVDELAADIKAHGLLQPLLVRRCGEGYELVAGHSRLAACKQLRMETVPCTITDGHDTRRAMLQLAENIQREDLSPYDIALALRGLRDTSDSIADTARRVGKSIPWVTQHLDYASLFDNLSRDGIEPDVLNRVPMVSLLELKAVPSAERAPLLRQIVSADPKQRVPSQAQFRRILDAKRTVPRKKRGTAKPSFRIHRHGLVLTLEFETKLGVRRITQILLERGGRVAL